MYYEFMIIGRLDLIICYRRLFLKQDLILIMWKIYNSIFEVKNVNFMIINDVYKIR